MKKLCFMLMIGVISASALAQQATMEYWPNGNKKSEGIVLGAQTILPGDSKEIQAQKLQNARKDGKWTYWFENGKISGEEHYLEGIQTGLWKTWYENGNPESQLDFQSYKATYWFANGQKQSEGKMYVGFVKDGKWTAWHENGKVNFEGSYKMGKKDGLWTWYNEKGEKISEQLYKDDQLVLTK
jgi:uncharacterized protein